MQQKKTKIICTISDLNCEVGFLRSLYENGMNVVRINSAHATLEGAQKIVDNVRAVSDKIAILIDTKGPEVRLTGMSSPKGIEVRNGDILYIYDGVGEISSEDALYTNCSTFVHDVPVGSRILIDDGSVELLVRTKTEERLECNVRNAGVIKGKKSINVPNVHISLPSLTEKDRIFVHWAIENDIDFIAHSFVRTKKDVLDVQEILDKAGTTYALSSTEKLAATEPVPMDWCYVYNFQNPMKPLAISFEAGIGKQFRDDMAEFVVQIRKELSKAFLSEDYEKQKRVMVHSFEDRQDEMFDEMSVLADEYDFMLKSMDSSIYFIPIVNGEPVEDENYDVLSDDEKTMIEKKNQMLQEKIAPFMREIHELQKECDKLVDELIQKVGKTAIGHHVEKLLETYKKYDCTVSYINDVQKDVLENLDQFMDEEQSHEDILSTLIPLLGRKQEEDVTLRYRVNLIVDHSQTQGAPVVATFNPTYSNLMGEIEYDSEFGSLTTDFMKIKSGLFHQANGGYLIVQAHDILSIPHAWESLRSVIKTKEINIDSIFCRQNSCNFLVSIIKYVSLQIK